MKPAEIKATAARALASAEAVCRHWLPEGKRQGTEWVSINPTRHDKTPGSFSVNLTTGVWSDFATGDKGADLVALVAYLEHRPQGEAAESLVRWMGGDTNPANPAGGRREPKAMPTRPTAHRELGRPSAQWEYLDSNGSLICIVMRFETLNGKEFRLATHEADGWRWKAPGTPRPLYGLDRLAARPEAPVILAEGEKAADAAAALLPNCVGIASMNGAQSPDKSDWSPMKGRRVLIWPDADAPGAQFAQTAATLATKAGAKRVEVLDLSSLGVELPAGWDAADALAEGWTPERFGKCAVFNPANPANPPPVSALIATPEELASARLAPRCIVKDHTYADVAQLVAPGGTGKTTIMLWESIHIALGRPLWGLQVESPGWTLIITAEDQRERLVARLREILSHINLTAEEYQRAVRSVRIWDVTGQGLKLVRAADGNLIVTTLADDIIEAYRADPPAVVVFDPLVSFGASESMVNDNEQAIITAARRIVNGLECCVRLVHHTGKANGRDKTLDQYSGRGGSALADGSRMTSVLQSWTPDQPGGLTPPLGCDADKDAGITVLARAKLSYSKPNLPLIWIKRTGWTFEYFTEIKRSPEEVRAAKSDQLERFLISEIKNDRRYTKSMLDNVYKDISMSRSEGRAALTTLVASRRVREEALPREMQRGGKQTYLHPVEMQINSADSAGSERRGSSSDVSNPADPPPPRNPAAAYRERIGGGVEPPISSPFLSTPPRDDGGVRRGWWGGGAEADMTSIEIDPHHRC